MLTTWLILAAVAETVTQYIKDILNGGFNLNKAIALLVAFVVCLGANVDIFKLLEIDFYIPYVGIVFAALITSRGANAIHDLLDLIKS